MGMARGLRASRRRWSALKLAGDTALLSPSRAVSRADPPSSPIIIIRSRRKPRSYSCSSQKPAKSPVVAGRPQAPPTCPRVPCALPPASNSLRPTLPPRPSPPASVSPPPSLGLSFPEPCPRASVSPPPTPRPQSPRSPPLGLSFPAPEPRPQSLRAPLPGPQFPLPQPPGFSLPTSLTASADSRSLRRAGGLAWSRSGAAGGRARLRLPLVVESGARSAGLAGLGVRQASLGGAMRGPGRRRAKKSVTRRCSMAAECAAKARKEEEREEGAGAVAAKFPAGARPRPRRGRTNWAEHREIRHAAHARWWAREPAWPRACADVRLWTRRGEPSPVGLWRGLRIPRVALTFQVVSVGPLASGSERAQPRQTAARA